MTSGTILVDIDGTLFDANTTFDFLDHYFGDSWSYRLFRRFSKTFIGRVINKLSIVICHVDMIRTIGVRRLKGYSITDLRNRGEGFYEDYLVKKKHEDVIDAVKNEQALGYHIVLASATLDFLARMIAEKINADGYTSTELLYENGICLGLIKSDRLGQKEEALQKIGITFPVKKTYTDNITDIYLLGKSEEGVVIVYPKERRKWLRLKERHHLSHIIFIQHENIV